MGKWPQYGQPSHWNSYISAFGDIGGFRHDDLTQSPSDTHFFTPIGNSNTSIDLAWKKPDILVRTHYDGTRGSISKDHGLTWANFATSPAAAVNNNANDPGYIAISTQGSRIVWQPRGADLYWSADSGATWAKSMGAPTPTADWNRFVPTADKEIDGQFYLQDPRTTGAVYRSIDGGKTWALAGTPSTVPSDAGGWAMQSVPGNAGHLWLPEGDGGLHRSTNSGSNWQKISVVQACTQVGFGKAAAGKTYPAIYVYAKINNVSGFYRSEDEGNSWVRINTDIQQFGWIAGVSGDPKLYGRIYIMTSGRGLIYGDPN